MVSILKSKSREIELLNLQIENGHLSVRRFRVSEFGIKLRIKISTDSNQIWLEYVQIWIAIEPGFKCSWLLLAVIVAKPVHFANFSPINRSHGLFRAVNVTPAGRLPIVNSINSVKLANYYNQFRSANCLPTGFAQFVMSVEDRLL